jgi:hypothetical protein
MSLDSHLQWLAGAVKEPTYAPPVRSKGTSSLESTMGPVPGAPGALQSLQGFLAGRPSAALPRGPPAPSPGPALTPASTVEALVTRASQRSSQTMTHAGSGAAGPSGPSVWGAYGRGGAPAVAPRTHSPSDDMDAALIAMADAAERSKRVQGTWGYPYGSKRAARAGSRVCRRAGGAAQGRLPPYAPTNPASFSFF